MDETHSNPHRVWLGQSGPKNPSEAEWRAMRKAQHLALAQPVSRQVVDTSFSTSFTLNKQAGTLIILGRKRPLTGRNALVEIEAEDYDGQACATKEDSNDTSLGQSISVAGGGHVYFDNVDYTDDGVASVELRAKAQNDTTVELRADCPTGPLLGSCVVGSTANAWATQTCGLSWAPTGVSRLYVLFGGAAHLNWLRFQPGGGVDGGAGGSADGGGGGCENYDAGVPACASAGDTSSGCGCRIGGASGLSGTLLAVGLFVAVLALRRQRPRRGR